MYLTWQILFLYKTISALYTLALRTRIFLFTFRINLGDLFYTLSLRTDVMGKGLSYERNHSPLSFQRDFHTSSKEQKSTDSTVQVTVWICADKLSEPG